MRTTNHTPRLFSALLFGAITLATALTLPPLHGEALARGKRAKKAQKPSGPAYWIHRQDDKPLGWLFASHLSAARKKKERVVVMFTADWCSPCKAIKELVKGSAVVRKAFRKHRGRLLYIDVDEWRGPAHRLIPGVNPRKLPTLVRIDQGGRKVIETYGSQLGLLSEDAVAHNFGRLIDGKPLEKPFYEGNSAKQTQLIRAQASAREKRNKGVKELVVRRLKGGKVRLRIVNLDGPRRWFLVPLSTTQPLPESPRVATMDVVKFNEHVRAWFLRFTGDTPFMAVPVAGYGDVDLVGWPLPGKGKKLEVWELNRLEVDGTVQQFERKLPYHLNMARAGQTTLLRSTPVKQVKVFVKRKLSAKVR